MTFNTANLNDLAELALIACDQAYLYDAQGGLQVHEGISTLAPLDDTSSYGNPQPPYAYANSGFIAQRVIDDKNSVNPTGFKAVIYKNDQTNEIVVAFAGTDGPNLVDWWSSIMTLGWGQWESNRNNVLAALAGVAGTDLQSFTGKINFTGQSLGGALAQYASYEFVRARREQAAQDNSAYDASRITLTTFNALGGLAALRDHGGYDSSVLTGLGSATHYAVENDVVHLLGDGLVGGTIKKLLVFNGTPKSDGRRLLDNGGPFSFGFADAHRIESGFYQTLSQLNVDFRNTADYSPAFLQIDHLQQNVGRFGNPVQVRAVSSVEAGINIVAGTLPGAFLTIASGNGQEVNSLIKVLVDSFYHSGDIASHKTAEKLANTRWDLWVGFFGVIGVATGGLGAILQTYVASMLLGRLATAVRLGSADLSNGLQQQFGVSSQNANIADQEIEQVLAQGDILLARADPTSVVSKVQADPEELARRLSSGQNWLADTLSYLGSAATAASLEAPEKTKTLVAGVTSELRRIIKQDAGTNTTFLTEASQQLDDFAISVVRGLANANSDFTAKYSSANTSLFSPDSLGAVAYAACEKVLDAAINDPIYRGIKSFLETARDIVAEAGQQAVVLPGAARNPFNDPNFDPDVAAVPSSNVADGDANSYTIFLPYAAGEGGQRIHLKLEGTDADKLAVIANGQTLTVVNGEFDVTITAGERALTFALLDEESVAADASLTLKATLVDSEGNPTHQTHTELTLTLEAPEDPTTADQAFTNTINGDQTPTQPDDELYGTAANDKVVGGEGSDYVFAGAGKDWVQGGNGSDPLFGVQGNDLIEGGAGTDIIGGGEDDDQLFADGKADKAAALASDATTAGATTDFLDGYSGDDQLVGSTGADTLLGGAGADLLIAGAGDDFLYGDRDGVYSGTTATIQATVGDVNPEGSDDTLFGGGGADTMYGEIGDDALFGNAGDDEMYGDAEDLVAAFHGDDYLDGGAGNDFLVGGLGNDDIIGGVGNDQLFADSDNFAVALHGDDYLEGGAGNDFLAGMGGSDILTGGEGDDEIAGGEGEDELYGGDGTDQLDAGAGDDYLDAGAGDDVAQGGEGQDTLYGEEGDDQLIGDRGAEDPDGGAADWMEGGAGADALFGQGGDDTLFGDEGNDQLVAGIGDDYLDGGEGNDVLLGEAGGDTLAGGAGQDVLTGGAGRDTYVLERGDGLDIAVDSLFAADDPEASVVTLGAGISRDDVRLHVGAASIDLGSGPTDYVTLVVDAGGGDSIAFAGFDPQNPGAASLFGALSFLDGTTLAYTDVLDLGFDTAGTDGNDFIEGTVLDDRIDGRGGHDTLLGNSGDDVLTGGTGNDELIGGFGKDTYVFNPGDGIDVVDEQPLLAGSADASVLELGTGDFTLRLDSDDSMMVDLGDGDRISLRGFDPDLPFVRPVLGELRAAGASYTFDEVLARGFDLDGTSADNVMHGTAVTDRISAFDGDDRIDGRAGDDTIDGGDGDDIMTGGAGNDTLTGGAGADIMHGGLGDDTILAGADDVVLDTEGTNHLDLTAFAGLNAANLEITQYEADGGDLYLSFHVRDAAHIGETPESGDVAVQSGETGSFATVTLNDSVGGAVTMTMEELLGQYAAGSFVFRGTDRADTLFGTAYGDSMYGGLGNDEIRGNAGDDELGGGQGDDTLIGGAGNDRYLLGFSTGRDTVVEDGSAEPLSVHTIQLEAGITSELLAGLRVGDDLHVRIDATGDALVIQDFYDQPQSWQDNWLVRDAQGQSVNLTTLLSSAPAPTEDWLAEQKQAYRVQREQAFSAGRQADGFGAIGGTTHRRVEYGFSYGANRTTTRTTLQRMVQGSIAFVQANGSINAGPIRVSSETVTETATITVAHPVFSSAGSGRGRVSQSAGQTGGTASLPEGAMLWITKSAFPGQISGHGWLVSAGDVLIPVYGPRVGIPPNDGIDHSGTQTVPANINNPAAYELVGFRVHHGSPGQQPVAHQTPVVNPTVVVPISTTIDEAYHVPDAVGGGESNTVIAASSTLVEAGDGNDVVLLGSMPANSQDLSAFFAGRDWRSGIAADSLVDRFSPSDSQYRYLAAHKPMSARNSEEERLADPASRLGGFVDAGAGDDQVSGSEAKDTIAGGDGADTIDGGGGSDTYLYTGNETGVDTLADSGADLVAYFDWFYSSQGILNWDERLLQGGRYRFNNDDQDYAQWEGTSYSAPDEVPGGPRYQYIAPLPVTPPVLMRSDTAQLEQLVAKGVLSRDVVKFGPGLTLGDLELQISDGDTLQVRWGNAGFDVEIPTEDFGLGGVDLLSQEGMNSYQIGLGVEIFQFADGSSYSLPQILALAATTIVGTPGDDVLVGTAGDELIKGLAGDDDISGGQGNDRLQGNAGDDIYRFARGDGADTIYDADAQAGNADTVAFGEDIAPEDVTYARTSSNLVLSVAGGGTVTVQGQFAEATRVEQFAFADGTIWDAATIAAALNRAPVLVAPIADQRVSEYGSFELALPEGMFRDFDAEDILVYEATLADGSPLPAWLYFDTTLTFSGIPQPVDAGDITLRVSATDGYGVSAVDEFALTVGVFGTEDNDFLQGSEYGELIVGYGGDDFLVGGDGADTLAGGTGNFDWLEGGEGDDAYVYEAGDGIDGVSDAGGNDSVRFGDGITPDDVLVTRDPYGTLFLVVPGAADRIELYDWFSDEQRKIESVEFADGTVWDAAELESRITTAPATEASDILNLSDGDDVVDGLGGDDQIFGNAGNDIIDGGDGWDYIEGGAGHNLVLGGEGDDSLNPGIGNGRAFYAGGAGRDSIGTSTSGSVVALNAGDGVDFLFSSPADPFALSIGGVSTADITLSMAEGGSAVRIGISADDGLTSYVYAGDPSSWPQGTLQLIGEDIRTYDLNAVVQAFLDARAQDPEITEWSAAATLVDNLLTVSTTEALGGALAWQYATTGDLAALSTADKQGVLQSADFAVSPQSITATPPENHAPVVSASNGEVLISEAAAADSLFTVTDADDDAITQYQFWDDVEGGGYWSVNGVQQAAAQTITVEAGDLGATLYVAGVDPGAEQVWVRANDGIGWSAWKNWNMTSALHIPNAAPEITAPAAQTVVFNESVNASSLFSASDADDDPIVRYEFWDSTAGNGRFTVDGIEQGVNVAIPVSDLQQVQFSAAGSIGSDLVWVRANDGQEWGDWKSWTMNSSPHATNAAPVVSASDATLLTNEAVAADSLFSVSDADDDAITQYQFWDDVNGGGYWRVDGVQQAAAQTISVSASRLADTEYVAGASGGTERVWVRASDGMEWSVWKPWNVTTALHVPNSAPAVSASASQTVLLNDAVGASSLFDVSDADDDPITQYEFWDSTAGNGHFTGNGIEQGVNVAIAVSSEDLADTRFVGSGTAGSDLVWVRANDGQVWSDWRSWTMQSSPHLTNAAPVVTAANNGLLRNEAVAASSLFSVDDADDDAITQYEFWDDVNGGGRFEIDGVQQVAGQTIAVDAAELDDVRYVGGANAGTERVWVRASDAMAWGQWQSWLMSTEGGMLRGGTGPDTLNGDPDTPVLEGGAGDDTLNASDGNSLLSGGGGEDAMNGGEGNDVFAGGSGDDVIHTGGGQNVVLFNVGGGTDTVWSDSGSSQTVSLGGGIGYDGLTLSKNGDDLILNTGGDDHLVLKDWYAGKDDVDKLQVVLDASGAYDPGSEDPLYNGKVETFDFRGLVNQFDQARAEAPGLTSWAMTNALLAFHLSRSDDEAIGGDLAYWYGKNGAFTGISLQAAQQVIGAPGFGSEAQQLRAFAGLQDGFVKLT